jgi:2-(1,2-epoxy-1,2-dihydrophenyl)acetyl-CoA isomerase
MTTGSLPPSAGANELPVQCWHVDGLVHLRFNRPQSLNAIDVAMAQAFARACHAIAAEPGVRVVVVSGAGRAFMAGGDLAAMQANPVTVTHELITCMHDGLRALSTVQAPVVAALHGAVAGAGLGVALACDLSIAAEDTRFNVAYPRIGATPDCGTSFGLLRAVGLRKAMELCLLSDPFDAAQALRLGLVNQVVPAAALQQEVNALAGRLAAAAPIALAGIKRLLHSASQRDYAGQLDAEAQAFAGCARSADFAEGMSAFLQRRKPEFQGV